MVWLIIGILAVISLGIFIANNAETEFVKAYNEKKKIKLENNKTVAEFLDELQSDFVLGNVQIIQTDKELDDGYFKSINSMRLSSSTLEGDNLASFCIVAHELGHAEQNANEDKKYLASSKIRKLSKILGVFTFPLAIVGVLLMFFIENQFLSWFVIGISIFSLILILISNLLITLVEFDASKRAISILCRYGILNEKETKQARKFLKSAGYTYLGNFCSTLFCWTFLVPNPKII